MSTFIRTVYNKNQLVAFRNVTTQGEIIAGNTGDVAVIAAPGAKYAIVIRKVIINVYTSAAQAFQFQADGSGGDPFFNVAASPGVGPKSIDYGELGFELPANEGVEIALGVTGGNAFVFVVEAFVIPVATMVPSEVR